MGFVGPNVPRRSPTFTRVSHWRSFDGRTFPRKSSLPPYLVSPATVSLVDGPNLFPSGTLPNLFPAQIPGLSLYDVEFFS